MTIGSSAAMRPPARLADWIEPTPQLSTKLADALPHSKPPARIVVFRFYMHSVADLLPSQWRAIAELDIDDWEHATRRSLAVLAARHRRYREALDHWSAARGYARQERDLLGRYRMVHVAACEDRSALEARARDATINARPNSIADLPVPAQFAPSSSRPRVLFVGAIDYLPNEDAAIWLARSISPRLRKIVPDATIAIAGRNAPDSILRLHGRGIEYLGAPKDLTEIYRASRVVVAPLRAGGGTKLKVLEAWLHRRPLVATSHAARGYGARDGKHLLVADSAADIAAACARLLREPELAEHLVGNGYELLASRYLLPAPDARHDCFPHCD